jgi:bifunctional non-homologous end joining protein LigD
MKTEQVSLYFCSGPSNKEYHAFLVEENGLYLVNFSFGRRGSTLQAGTKTQSPLPYEQAKKIFDALVRSKLAKGYTPGESGTPYEGTSSEKRSTGILPQLLNQIKESEVAGLVADQAFFMQEKKDGKRVLIRKESGDVTGINRKGLAIGLPEPVAKIADTLEKSFVLDGECVGDVYFAFDLLSLGSKDMRGLEYDRRLRVLTDLLDGGSKGIPSIRLIETARSLSEKAAMLARLKKEGREGVVFKDREAPYTVGRPASGGSQLKFKFYATASCIVSKHNAKRSVSLELLDGGGKAVGVGNVTIPPNQAIPKEGEIIEVRYLHAFPGGSLYQPTCLGIRDDVERRDCVIGQLKYRAKDDEDEA